MKVVLVTCFNANWILGRVPSPYIPLNLLTLGTRLRNSGHEVEIVDQTLALLQGKATDGPRFHHQIAELVHAAQPDVVGLTTMCNSYPQTLILARHYREVDPQAKIILGGPQATVTDIQTMEHFPWIDAVVRGEADNSLTELLDCWENSGDLGRVAGITWRDNHDQLHQNDDAPFLQDLDNLPFPAYDLYPLDETNIEFLPIEAGRGCPFGCTFCSTSRFFHRRTRLKSVERLVTEMIHINETCGATGFDLVHDMLTVNRRWMTEFCQTLIERRCSFHWGCSARIDCVDEDLLAQMSKAGCMGVFFGIETGSQRLQPIIKKKLKLEHVLPTIRTCVEHEMKPTASFITGFPDETPADMLDSFNMALDVLALSPKTNAQMHLLAPLIGSPVYEAHKGELKFDGHSSDISHFLLADAEIETVRRYPEIFPNFYYIPTPQLDRDLTKATSAAVYTCPELFIALRYAGLKMRDVLKRWVIWQRLHVNKNEIGQDYYMYRFGLDLCRYLRAKELDSVTATAPFLKDLVDYFEVRYALQKGHTSEQTLFRQFEYNVRHLNKVLREKASWPLTVEPASTDLLFTNLTFNPERGYVYLEVKVPRTQDPLVRPGDELEIRDPVKQLRTRPHLIVRNNTQKRVFATKHHMTEHALREMGLAAA